MSVGDRGRTSGKAYFPCARIGELNNLTGYTDFEQDGTYVSRGNATQWDDVYVAASSVAAIGTLGFVQKQFRSDDDVGLGFAISMDGVDQYGAVADYANLDVSGDWSIEMWIKPNQAGTILKRADYWTIGTTSNQRLGFQGESGAAVVTSPSTIAIGAWQHIAITGEQSGTDTIIKIYVNGNLEETETRAFVLGANANDMYIGSDETPGDYFDGAIDDLIMYNVVLTGAQVVERWNSNAGTDDLPTGITEATEVIGRFKFDEGNGSTVDNGSTLGAGEDMTLNNDVSWVAGIIGGSGNPGVFLPAFESGKLQGATFDFGIPHGWYPGTALKPHVHITTTEAITAGDKIVISYQYTFAVPNSVFPATTVVDRTITFSENIPAYTHTIIPFDEVDTSSVAATVVSPHIPCSFFRKGDDADDTFEGDIFLLNFGIHYQHDMIGSHQEYVK